MVPPDICTIAEPSLLPKHVRPVLSIIVGTRGRGSATASVIESLHHNLVKPSFKI